MNFSPQGNEVKNQWTTQLIKPLFTVLFLRILYRIDYITTEKPFSYDVSQVHYSPSCETAQSADKGVRMAAGACLSPDPAARLATLNNE